MKYENALYSLRWLISNQRTTILIDSLYLKDGIDNINYEYVPIRNPLGKLWETNCLFFAIIPNAICFMKQVVSLVED